MDAGGHGLEDRIRKLEEKVSSLEAWRSWTYGLGSAFVMIFAFLSGKIKKLLGLE